MQFNTVALSNYTLYSTSIKYCNNKGTSMLRVKIHTLCQSERARRSTCRQEKCKKINPYLAFEKGFDFIIVSIHLLRWRKLRNLLLQFYLIPDIRVSVSDSVG